MTSWEERVRIFIPGYEEQVSSADETEEEEEGKEDFI